jgi:hypothetical protein
VSDKADLVTRRQRYIERQRELKKETVNVNFAGMKPMGTGSLSRDGLPRLPIGQHEVKNWVTGVSFKETELPEGKNWPRWRSEALKNFICLSDPESRQRRLSRNPAYRPIGTTTALPSTR